MYWAELIFDGTKRPFSTRCWRVTSFISRATTLRSTNQIRRVLTLSPCHHFVYPDCPVSSHDD